MEETKTGVPLELPITRQLADIFERRRPASDNLPNGLHYWLFPSPTSATGHVRNLHHVYPRISKAGTWLVNHARPNDVTEGYAADWTVEQLREPAHRIADGIETPMSVAQDR